MQAPQPMNNGNGGGLFSEGEQQQFKNFLNNFQDASEAEIVGGTNLVLHPPHAVSHPAASVPSHSNDRRYGGRGGGVPYPAPIPASGSYPSESYPNYPYPSQSQPPPPQSQPYYTPYHPPPPSHYQPQQQQPARPSSSYPISFSSAISSLPPAAQTQLYEQERLREEERTSRMEKQKKDLEEWMKGKGVVESSEKGKERYHERPATTTNEDGRTGMDTMRSLREAEIKAGLVHGGKNSNRSSGSEGGGEASRLHSHQREWQSGPPTAFYRPPQPQSIPIMAVEDDRMDDDRDGEGEEEEEEEILEEKPKPIKKTAKKPATREKHATTPTTIPKKRQSKGKAKVDVPSSTSASSENPGPAITPSNIPPAPTPYHPPLLHSTSTSTLTSSTSKPKVNKALQTSSEAKPALLSAAQKKANHIASEQKRRAAIRLGYEGLCSVVPSLKAAVEEFEERVRVANAGNGGNKKKRGQGAGGMSGGALMGGIDVGGEKVDGRAGPKSEAVVLVKSVDYVRELLENRQKLLDRLSATYQLAEAKGIKVEGGPRVWEHIWDEVGSGLGEEEDGEWSEEE